METSLRNRLTFGPMMLGSLFLLLWLDHVIQRWTVSDPFPRGVAGVGLLGMLWMILPLATYELSALFTAEKVRPYRFIAAAGCFMLILHAWATQFPKFQVIAASSLAFIVVFVMLLAALCRAAGQHTQEAITRMAGTVLATLYLGGLAWFLMALRVKSTGHFHGSTFIILTILVVVKFTDIGAYFGGRALGRNKLILWLSPGKTWEGLACGMIVAGCVGMACAPFINVHEGLDTGYSLPWWKGFVFGFLIGGIGQLGDLLESLMKRDAEVKDSSSLIPGFGGVLDVIDSPVFAAPFAYLLFSLF